MHECMMHATPGYVQEGGRALRQVHVSLIVRAEIPELHGAHGCRGPGRR